LDFCTLAMTMRASKIKLKFLVEHQTSYANVMSHCVSHRSALMQQGEEEEEVSEEGSAGSQDEEEEAPEVADSEPL